VTAPAVAAAVAAGLVEELGDDVRDQLAEIKAAVAAPAMSNAGFDVFAQLLMARIEPRLTILEERAAKLEARLAGISSTLTVICRQQQPMRRLLR
jgi:hypothetical protein